MLIFSFLRRHRDFRITFSSGYWSENDTSTMVAYPEPDSQTARRASEGDVQASGLPSADGVEQEDTEVSQRHHSHSPVTRPGLQGGSSEMTRAFSNQDVSTGPTPSGSRLNRQPKASLEIAVPESLLPQPAGNDRPSADPSLIPMMYPTIESPAIWPNVAGASQNRPQSRTTTSSTTPPNMYECLPYNLYTSLHIHPQDPRQAPDSNNGLQSPTSPVLSSGTGASQPAYSESWALPADGQRSSYGIGRAAYSTTPPYRQNGNNEGLNGYQNINDHGCNVNGTQSSTYQPAPNTNLAFMSMQQTMDPRLFPGMQHYGGGYPYQGSYHYHNAASGSAYSPAAAPGWIAVQPNGMPYAAHPSGGAFYDGRPDQQMHRGRGRSRGRSRGRGRASGNGSSDHASQQHWYQNREYHSTQGVGAGDGHGRWLNTEHRSQRTNFADKRPSQPADQASGQNFAEGHGVRAGTEEHVALESIPALSARDGHATKPGGITGVRVLERKAYHPAPPANRSEWVMWVGNV